MTSMRWLEERRAVRRVAGVALFAALLSLVLPSTSFAEPVPGTAGATAEKTSPLAVSPAPEPELARQAPDAPPPHAPEATANAAAPARPDAETRRDGSPAVAIDRSTLPHDLSPWNMFLAADIVVKAVMTGLAAASFLVWTIWLGKIAQLWFARRRLQQDLAALSHRTSLSDAADTIPRKNSLARLMLEAARREYDTARSLPHTTAPERVATRLGEIETQANRSIRGGMSFLATVGATAPFIGLFGTVWGIMNSFIGISKSQTTNLAVVAPGIAEALLATAIGLVAAIPAVILYNQLGHGIAAFKRLTRETKGEVGRIASRQLEHQLAERSAHHLRMAAE